MQSAVSWFLHEFNPIYIYTCIVKRKFLTRERYDRTKNRWSGIESSIPRDREPIDVRANVTKPFFLKRRGENQETTLLTSPQSNFALLEKWDAGAKIPFPPVRHTVSGIFFFQHACTLLNGLERRGSFTVNVK